MRTLLKTRIALTGLLLGFTFAVSDVDLGFEQFGAQSTSVEASHRSATGTGGPDAAPGGPTASFERVLSQERKALTGLTGSKGLADDLVYKAEDTPSGRFRVRLESNKGMDGLLSTHFTTTNCTIANFVNVRDTNLIYEFDVIPDSSATEVSIVVPEDTIMSRDGTYNQRWEQTWSVVPSQVPTLLGAGFSSPNARGVGQGPYNAGDPVDIAVLFSEQVKISFDDSVGRPSIDFTIGDESLTANYLEGDGTEKLVFRHVLVSALGTEFAKITSDAINLPTQSSIKDLTETEVGNVALPPRIVSGTLKRSVRPDDVPSDFHTWAGRTYDYDITFNASVNVEGAPALVIQGSGINDELIYALASYVSGSGSDTLTFSYIVPRNHNFNPRSSLITKDWMEYPANARITDTNDAVDALPYIKVRYTSVASIFEGESLGFSFSLTSRPSDEVLVEFESNPPGLFSFSPSSVTFTPENCTPQPCDETIWNIPQRFVVTAELDDNLVDETGEVVFTFDNSLDPLYAGLSPIAHVTLHVKDLGLAPEIGGLLTISLPENTTGVFHTLQNTAPVSYPVIWALYGADADSFSINPDAGQLSVGPQTHLNFESGRTTYEFTAEASAGSLSDIVDITVLVTDVDEPPEAPAVPVVTGNSYSTLDLRWRAPVNTGPPINDYDVRYRREDASRWATHEHNGTATATTVANLSSDERYELQVRARNDEGTSPWSESAFGSTKVKATPTPTPVPRKYHSPFYLVISTPTPTPTPTPEPVPAATYDDLPTGPETPETGGWTPLPLAILILLATGVALAIASGALLLRIVQRAD